MILIAIFMLLGLWFFVGPVVVMCVGGFIVSFLIYSHFNQEDESNWYL